MTTSPAALDPPPGAAGIPHSSAAGNGEDGPGRTGPGDGPLHPDHLGISHISASYGDPQAARAHEMAFGWH